MILCFLVWLRVFFYGEDVNQQKSPVVDVLFAFMRNFFPDYISVFFTAYVPPIGVETAEAPVVVFCTSLPLPPLLLLLLLHLAKSGWFIGDLSIVLHTSFLLYRLL